MVEKKTDSQKLEDETIGISEDRMSAVLSYIPFIVFVPLLGSHRHNKFVRRHARQGLLLLIIEVVALLFMMPALSQLFWSGVFVVCLFFAAIGAFHAIQGEEWKVPYIGHWIDKYKTKL